jgi:carboxylesterase type B
MRTGTGRETAWTSFAGEWNLSTPELAWPAYELASRPIVVFDRQTRIINNPRSSVHDAVLSFCGQ